MDVKLYYNVNASPSRAVIYTLEALNVPYELIKVSLPDNEQFTERYLKLNPQHTIPTIQDEDGFVLWDRLVNEKECKDENIHAINVYLMNKYGKDDKLYPKESKARAIVDQMLHFDNGVLFVSLMNNIKRIIVNEISTKVTDDLKNPVEEAYEFLEKFLHGRQFAAGNNITIADFSILTTLTNLSGFVPLNGKKYPFVENYIKRSETAIPGFKELETKAKQSLIEILKALNFEFNY